MFKTTKITSGRFTSTDRKSVTKSKFQEPHEHDSLHAHLAWSLIRTACEHLSIWLSLCHTDFNNTFTTAPSKKKKTHLEPWQNHPPPPPAFPLPPLPSPKKTNKRSKGRGRLMVASRRGKESFKPLAPDGSQGVVVGIGLTCQCETRSAAACGLMAKLRQRQLDDET